MSQFCKLPIYNKIYQTTILVGPDHLVHFYWIGQNSPNFIDLFEDKELIEIKDSAKCIEQWSQSLDKEATDLYLEHLGPKWKTELAILIDSPDPVDLKITKVNRLYPTQYLYVDDSLSLVRAKLLDYLDFFADSGDLPFKLPNYRDNGKIISDPIYFWQQIDAGSPTGLSSDKPVGLRPTKLSSESPSRGTGKIKYQTLNHYFKLAGNQIMTSPPNCNDTCFNIHPLGLDNSTEFEKQLRRDAPKANDAMGLDAWTLEFFFPVEYEQQHHRRLYVLLDWTKIKTSAWPAWFSEKYDMTTFDNYQNYYWPLGLNLEGLNYLFQEVNPADKPKIDETSVTKGGGLVVKKSKIKVKEAADEEEADETRKVETSDSDLLSEEEISEEISAEISEEISTDISGSEGDFSGPEEEISEEISTETPQETDNRLYRINELTRTVSTRRPITKVDCYLASINLDINSRDDPNFINLRSIFNWFPLDKQWVFMSYRGATEADPITYKIAPGQLRRDYMKEKEWWL